MSQVRVLTESEALAAIDRTSVLSALETAFAGLPSGRSVQPTQTVTAFPDGAGDCIFYPGALLDLGLVGVKVSPYLQSLADAGKYPVTAYTLLLSFEDGRPLLLCDSYALTTIRTAATTALAVKYLAAEGSLRLGVIGSGKTAREHLRFASELGIDWESVTIWSPRIEEKAADLASEFQGIVIGSGAKEVAQGSDVLLLCTSSATAVVERDWIVDGALVCSISTNAPMAHEIEPASLPSYDVYCDYRATAPDTAGEMRIALEAGGWSSDAIRGDLPELITKVAAVAPGTKFFRSTGLGIEDLAIASLLF